MVNFACRTCQTNLSVADHLAGSMVRCPVCRTTTEAPAAADAVSEPQPEAAAASAPAPAGRRNPFEPACEERPPRRYIPPPGPVRRFGFPCCYCSSHLEATTDQSGNDGTCPTCSSAIVVPILGSSGQLIDPLTNQVIKPDPHPVHAYAAAGDRAPTIVKDSMGNRIIRCPRCAATSSISANVCSKCGVPFTIEGAEGVVSQPGNSLGVASLVTGIVSLPLFFMILPAVAAVCLGVMALLRSSGGSRGSAIAGIITGAISVLIAIVAMS
jgi:DNA-directed RNA polymerase subunit RPC12/RpoP